MPPHIIMGYSLEEWLSLFSLFSIFIGALAWFVNVLIIKPLRSDIKNLSNHYLNILNAVLENEEIKIADIDMLSEEEKNKILNEFNNTQANYPKDKTVVQLFEEQVKKTPEKTAVVFEDKKLTYRELNEKANSLAHYLRNMGIGRNDVVALLLDKSLEMIIAILAVIIYSVNIENERKASKQEIKKSCEEFINITDKYYTLPENYQTIGEKSQDVDLTNYYTEMENEFVSYP